MLRITIVCCAESVRVLADIDESYASLVRDQTHHHQVATWMDGNAEPLLTTDYCLAETLNLLMAGERLALATATIKRDLLD